MQRFLSALLIVPMLLLGSALVGAEEAPAAAAQKHKVVYHVSDEDKVNFALMNISNHIAGVGGPENVEIVLVTHGPAVKAFNDIEAVDRTRSAVARLLGEGVKFQACANTLEALEMAADELLPGFTVAEDGGVTRITELQAQGYFYIRP